MAEVDPYRPPEGRVEDVAAPGALNLASRGQRFAGATLDGLITIVAGVAASLLLSGLSFASDPSFFYYFIGGSVPVLIVNLYFLKVDGQTLGKKAVGTRILMRDGSRAGLGRLIILRMIAPGVFQGIPFVGFVFSLADALLIFRSDRRCIHDHMAGTVVVVA